MRKVLGLLIGGVAAYGVTVFLLRLEPKDPTAGTPAAVVTAGEAPATDPFAAPGVRPTKAASEPELEEEPAPEINPWGVDAPSRPNVRTLKMAGVPSPGEERTPEQFAQAREMDMSARAPAGSSFKNMNFGSASIGGSRAPSYRAPDIRRDEPLPQGADRLAGRGVRAGGAPKRTAGAAVAGAPAPAAGGTKTPASADAVAAVAPAAKTDAPPPGPEAVGWLPAAELVNEAKKHGFGNKPADAAAMLQLSDDPVGREMLASQAIQSGSRSALERLAKSGRPVSEEEEEDAVAEVMASVGVPPTIEEVREQIAIAQQPPVSPPRPLEMLDFLNRTQAALPPDDIQDRIANEAFSVPRLNPEGEQTPAPRGPPPRNAAAAYRIVRDALEKGQRDFGVAPRHAFGIFGVESAFGRNTGRYLVMPVLYSEIRTRAPGSARYRQAQRDVVAMFELERMGALGPGNTAANMRGSYGASFGHTQFRPSSWRAYGRDPDGGTRRDPYDMRTAVYSTANYLRGHGYGRNVDRAIYGYNHDWGYVRSVQGMASRVQSTIIAPSAAGR